MAVLAGWAVHVEWIKRIVPGATAMNPLTAVCMIAAGAALLGTRSAQPAVRGAAVALIAGVLLVGITRFASYAAGVGYGIDVVLFREHLLDPARGTLVRMAPNTALNFILLSAALLLGSGVAWRLAMRQALCFIVLLQALMAVVGYIFGSTPLYQVGAHIPMALPTAYGFVIASAAVLCANPDLGVMRNVSSEALGGIMARRLLPVAVLAPILIGAVRLAGQNRGWYDVSFGRSLYVIAMIATLVMCTWWMAASLNSADRLRAEAVEDLNRFFTLSVDLLCIADMDGYFKRLSPAFHKVLGWDGNELLTRPFMFFVHPDDAGPTLKEVERQAGGASVMLFQNRYRCKDGGYRLLEWTSQPYGERMYAVARDVTEREHAARQIRDLNAALASRARQLEDANKELEAFSYSVSHDLRAPLRHMSGFIELFNKHVGDGVDEKGRRYLGVITEASATMGALIDDLLSFSRMGRSEMRGARVDTGSMARAVIDELKRDAGSRAVEWIVGDLPEVTADPSMLKQVFTNLLGNALKYTGPRDKAVIEVGAAPGDGEIIFRVRDNGVGFDMKYADKLFGVFQRLHTPDQFEGTGIGLATVRRIVARHGGRTWAEGAVDRGAVIYFSLPADRPANHHAPGAT